MKRAIHIFTFYMFTLSLVPCGDGGGGLMALFHYFSDVEHSIDTDHDHTNGCDDDFCSPFCICNCCSTAIDSPTKLPFRIKAPIPISNSTPTCFHNEISYSFNHSIWQPPRFS